MSEQDFCKGVFFTCSSAHDFCKPPFRLSTHSIYSPVHSTSYPSTGTSTHQLIFSRSFLHLSTRPHSPPNHRPPPTHPSTLNLLSADLLIHHPFIHSSIQPPIHSLSYLPTLIRPSIHSAYSSAHHPAHPFPSPLSKGLNHTQSRV